MPLPAGTRLGHYDISAPLGAGGMGEVYRARDSKLGREVALKTLPDSLTHDPERLARFRREAQLLAALNHPHIASIYGIEQIEGRHVLVLELVDGETLAARLRGGPLAIDEALSVGREIVLALEAAHERNIVHRDLKPGNIALTADGTVKVLDFGLARNAETAAGRPEDLVNSPTLTSPLTLTALGVILGTAAYMSPEQAKGAVADKRSDVWAFGCVLYEMLTGVRAFPGDDVTETLAAVVKSQPDWSLVPAAVPGAVRALLEGCLEKDKRKRISDIAAARFVLERPAVLNVPSPVTRTDRGVWPWLAVAATAVAVTIAALWFMRTRPEIPVEVTRFVVQLPPGEEVGLARRNLALSPDGRRLVYSAAGRLVQRSLSDFDAQPIPGTEFALQPAFSPDGQSLAFWSDGKIKRVALAGGVPVPVVDVSPAPYGLMWHETGIIYVNPGTGIFRVSANGAAPERLVAFRDMDGISQGPALLPDGDTLLFTLTGLSGQTNVWDTGQIVRQSLRTGERKVMIQGGSNPTYLSTGHLLYTVEGTLMAAPFDLAAREVTGPGVPVIQGIRRAAPSAGAEGQFHVSRSGTLAYIPGPPRAGEETVFVYQPDGPSEQLKLPRGTYAYPRASPDGKWLAMGRQEGSQWQIAVYDMAGTAAVRRLTFGGSNQFAEWAPDSKSVVFQSDREGDFGLFRQNLNGGAAERLTRAEPGTAHVPESWSSVADVLLYSVAKGNSYALRALSVKDRTSVPSGDVVSGNFPTDAMFSRDGRWVAYQSGEGQTGEPITFVQPYPATGTKYQIARGGRPLWSADGKQLFFVPGPGQFMVTKVSATPDSFAFTPPESAPRRFGLAPPANPRTYDFLRDGRLIGINAALPTGDRLPTQINVVQNWSTLR